MPPLQPKPNYGRSLPEIDDMYRLLAAGFKATIDGQRAQRLTNTRQLLDLEAELVAQQTALDQAIEAHAEAQSHVSLLETQTSPRHGIGAARTARRAAAGEVHALTTELKALELRIAAAQRYVDMLKGADRQEHPHQKVAEPAGKAKFGVYAFYDYDDRAIYVGKTTEGMSTRVNRHLTNQRTDAVGMSVLDPLEVAEVELWPIWQTKHPEDPAAYVARLEHAVELHLLALGSEPFNEKKIPPVADPPEIPASVRFELMTTATRETFGHPDLRIARRMMTAARLAGRISERQLRSVGLRRSLMRQLVRLTSLAEERFAQLGGEAAVTEDDGKD